MIIDSLDLEVNTAIGIAKNIPPGNTSYDPKKAVHLYKYDVVETDKILGIKYRSMPETTRDILEDFRARGWWNY